MKLLKDALHNCKSLKISDNHPTLIKDGIINTGNGSRPVSIFRGLSRKGNRIGNPPLENFFVLLKQEMFGRGSNPTYEELKDNIETYIITTILNASNRNGLA